MKNQISKIFIYRNNTQKQNLFFNLCIEVIKKNCINSFEIHIINNQNIKNYIDKNLLDKINSHKKRPSLEFLFFCVLYCNGGIFLQPEIILTKDFFYQLTLLNHFDLVFFAESLEQISKNFIMANKYSIVLTKLINNKSNFSDSFENITNNIKNNYANKIIILDNEKSAYLMEKKLFGITGKLIYQKCYFSNIVPFSDFWEKFNGILSINSKYTPKEYQNMDKQEFLKQDILISKIFNKLLS